MRFKEIFVFGFVGTLGFLVDSGILYLLDEHFGVYLARLVSFACAVFVTWICNRRITFGSRHSGKSLPREFAEYLAYMLLGGACNYGVYSLLVAHYATVHEHPVIGVAAGSLAGMFINFFSAKFFLFKNAKAI